MKTWHFEMAFVAIVLFIVNVLNKTILTIESLAAIAVLLNFEYAQIMDRMVEQEGLRERPLVGCYKQIWYYFIGKEFFWCLYFLLNKSYSALVGVAIFLFYPVWRDLYKKKIRKK